MHKHTVEEQREYLKTSGALHLLNYCVELTKEYTPRNPRKLILGVLKRENGLVLNKEELVHFVNVSTNVNSDFLVKTLSLSVAQDATCTDPVWHTIALRSAGLLVNTCNLKRLRTILIDPSLKAAPPLVSLIIHLTLSIAKAKSVTTAIEVSIIVPVTTDTYSKFFDTPEHPRGQGLVREQLKQIKPMRTANSLISLKLLYVDTSCEGTGQEAARRAKAMLSGQDQKVVDVLHDPQPVASVMECYKSGMKHCSDSNRHAVLAVDNTAVHLGLLGACLESLSADHNVVTYNVSDPQSYPPYAVSRGELVSCFVWKCVYPELPGQTVSLKSPLFGVSRRMCGFNGYISETEATLKLEICLHAGFQYKSGPAPAHPIFQFSKELPYDMDPPHLLCLKYYLSLAAGIAQVYPDSCAARSANWIEWASGLTPAKWQRVLDTVAAVTIASKHPSQFFSLDFQPSHLTPEGPRRFRC